jgi:hypothetical protein
MSEELKGCPFCGEIPKFKPYKNNGLTLKCPSLGCIHFDQRTLTKSIEWLQEKMIETWNTRAPLDSEVKGAEVQAVAESAIDPRIVAAFNEIGKWAGPKLSAVVVAALGGGV